MPYEGNLHPDLFKVVAAGCVFFADSPSVAWRSYFFREFPYVLKPRRFVALNGVECTDLLQTISIVPRDGTNLQWVRVRHLLCIPWPCRFV